MKQFSNFTNRLDIGLADKPLDTVLSMAKDEKWQTLRNIISPTFSSGKLRKMKAPMNMCAKQMVKNLRKKAKFGEEYNVKDYMGAFSMDCILSTAFGIDVDSQQDPNNPLIRHAAKVLNFSFKTPAVFIALFLPFLKPLSRKLGIKIIPDETLDYFKNILNQAMARRTENDKKTRTDFLQLILNACEENGGVGEEGGMENRYNGTDDKKVQGSHRKGLSYDDVLAQAFLFFLAGYSTISDNLAFASHALAKHPDIQEKLLQEIESVIGVKEEVGYDDLSKLGYMHMVLHESMRIYGVPRVDRVCSKDTTVNGVHIPKGMTVVIPVQAIQMDPAIWPEPEKFDPERFSPEKKAERNAYSWMSFGMGPRNCVGMGLALMEMKLALVYLIRNFKIKLCEGRGERPERNKMTGTPVNVILKIEERK